MSTRRLLTTTALMLLLGPAAMAQTPAPATHSVRLLTPETAQRIVQAALQACRAGGYQVAVAVVDRGGVAQAMLRDRFAGPHTPEVAVNKAWTAVSFRTDTTELARATQPGQASSGLRGVPRFTAVGGGIVVQAGGSVIGAVGVSGAPSGDADDTCAKAGVKAVQDELEM